MSEEATEKSDSHEVIGGLIIFLLICFLLYKGYEWIFKPSITLISLGSIRPVSCDFEGERLGGNMYSCTVRNFSNEPMQTSMSCASFDKSDRMIESPGKIAGLYETFFNAGEERIVTFFFNEKASTAECSQNGGIVHIQEANRLLDELSRGGNASKIKI